MHHLTGRRRHNFWPTVSHPLIITCLVTFGAARVSAQTPPQTTPITLAALEEMALELNPTLKQADAGIDAARGRAQQAGLLPNPTIGYTAEEVSGGPIIRGGEHGVFIEQTIPLGGKLRLSRQVFEREAHQAEFLRDAQHARVLNSVRVAFYAALAAQRRVEVRERLAKLASEATTVSTQLYNVGAADRPDLLSAEIEARQNRLELTSARNAWSRAWLTLASTVGDPTLAPRPLAGALDSALPELEREAALQTILERSPELAAATAAVERAQAALRRARREPVPDLVLRGGPRYNREVLEVTPAGEPRPVGWEVAFDVGVTVPLFNRNQGNVAAAQAEVTRAQHELRRLQLSLRSRFSVVFEEYLTALRMADTYQAEMLPHAEEAYRLYLARYQEMGAAYPQVLIAQRELFEVSDRYVAALEGVWRAATLIQGFLLTGGLEAPITPGEAPVAPDVQSAEMPGAVPTGVEGRER
ncbi:MAG: TolC family protein [Vicinamibacteraceae bacterium]